MLRTDQPWGGQMSADLCSWPVPASRLSPASQEAGGRSRLSARSRRGLTFTESVVYLVVFVLILGFVVQMIWGGRKAEAGRKRLGVFQDLRLSAQRINRKLSHATRILFPPPDGKPYHQIVFISETGELHVIYLNDKEQLYMLNYDAYKRSGEPPVLLARRTLEFTASRSPQTEDYVQFLARILDDQNFEFALTDGITVRNIIR